MEFRHHTLGNGLEILAEENRDAASMAVGFFVRTGSRDETPELSGVSHFLEHMVFKGTGRRTALEINREFDEIGARYNAFTSEENTVFYANVLPEFQQRAVDLLADILRPRLAEADFRVEKQVILEEIAMTDDMPKFRVYDSLMHAHFAGHPLGNMILGTRESIGALGREQMIEYFRRRYGAGNLTVVAVGRLDFDGLVRDIERRCSGWERGDAPREAPPPPSPDGQKMLVDANLSREHIGLMSPAPAGQDEQRFAAQLAAAVLGDATGSRLFYALVDPAICDEATMSYSPLDRAGVLITFLTADPEQAAEALRIARDEFRRFAEEGPADAELAAAKNKIATHATRKGELPMGRLSAVGFDWIYRRQYEPLAEQIDRVFAVSADEVRGLVRRWDLAAHTTLCLGPVEKL